ncbi:hypothetical protein [Ktedonobacter racemifer]|nr:hypothetical protein [Ktedonobacter racemifer]
MANAGAIAVGPASNPVVIARVYNWYSAACGTNWTQAEVTSAYSSLKIRIDIYRGNSQPVYCYPDDCHSFTTLNSGVQTWTNMALASQVFAYAEIVVLSPTDNLYHSATVAA